MALAIAGLAGAGDVSIDGAEAVAVSYPGFWQDLDRVSAS
jgi:3-phosphoshikimate 1-carboxyvinyltransferase